MNRIRVAGLPLFVIATAASVLFAQSFSIGVKGGLRATNDFRYAAGKSRPYVVGPAAELDLPLGFSVDCEALYRRQGYSAGNSTPLYAASIREADNVWEFPLLARYRIPLAGAGLFAEAGWVPRIMSGYQDRNGSYLSRLDPAVYTVYSSRTHADWPVTHGVAVGGGIRFAAGRLQVAPEVRYVHWNRQAISAYFPDGPSYGSTQDQLDVFLAIGRRMQRRSH